MADIGAALSNPERETAHDGAHDAQQDEGGGDEGGADEQQLWLQIRQCADDADQGEHRPHDLKQGAGGDSLEFGDVAAHSREDVAEPATSKERRAQRLQVPERLHPQIHEDLAGHPCLEIPCAAGEDHAGRGRSEDPERQGPEQLAASLIDDVVHDGPHE